MARVTAATSGGLAVALSEKRSSNVEQRRTEEVVIVSFFNSIDTGDSEGKLEDLWRVGGRIVAVMGGSVGEGLVDAITVVVGGVVESDSSEFHSVRP